MKKSHSGHSIMVTNVQSNVEQQRLRDWCDGIVVDSSGAKSLTIGLASGNRYPNDARVIFRIVKALSNSLVEHRGKSNLLLCRLNVETLGSGLFEPPKTSESVDARIEKSALGCWDFVEIDVPIGRVAPPSLQLIPRWLPKWQLRYHTIVVDLGPIHQVPSRTIGSICDAIYVVLGPNGCASAKWISQHVDHHTECGSPIAGTIVATAAA